MKYKYYTTSAIVYHRHFTFRHIESINFKSVAAKKSLVMLMALVASNGNLEIGIFLKITRSFMFKVMNKPEASLAGDVSF